MASLLVSPLKTGLNQVGRVLNLTGFGTAWTSTNPTFTMTGGPSGSSITGQSILNDTTATITITTGSVAGVATITDPSTTATFNIRLTSVANLPIPGFGQGDDWKRRRSLY